MYNRLVHIETEYIDYLSQFDKHVPYSNDGYRRPFFYVFDINGMPIFAPITSLKKNRLGKSKMEIKNGKYLSLNGSIPVPHGSYKSIDYTYEPRNSFLNYMSYNKFINDNIDQIQMIVQANYHWANNYKGNKDILKSPWRNIKYLSTIANHYEHYKNNQFDIEFFKEHNKSDQLENLKIKYNNIKKMNRNKVMEGENYGKR